MKVFKNFLKEKDFKNIKEVITSNNFPWYYFDNIVEQTDKPFDFQFVHSFYSDNIINSNYFSTLKPVLDIIKPYVLIKIKANLLTQSHKINESLMHIDNPTKPNYLKIKTGILYLDDSNGYTKFENGEIIKSENNKFIEFDSSIYHTGANCSNQHRRIVINFNYVV